MYNNEKKFRGSAVTTICYVLAALLLIYTCYQIGTTIHTINEYYAQYGMTATPVEYITYVSQNALSPLLNAIVLFMLATIHKEVRKNNPANYLSDEDIIEAGENKKAAKDAKQVRKAAEKAGQKPVAEEAVVADFTTAAPEKAEAEKTAPKKTRKPAAKKTEAEKKEGAAAKSTAAKKSSGSRKKSTGTKKAQEKKEAGAEETKKDE